MLNNVSTGGSLIINARGFQWCKWLKPSAGLCAACLSDCEYAVLCIGCLTSIYNSVMVILRLEIWGRVKISVCSWCCILTSCAANMRPGRGGGEYILAVVLFSDYHYLFDLPLASLLLFLSAVACGLIPSAGFPIMTSIMMLWPLWYEIAADALISSAVQPEHLKALRDSSEKSSGYRNRWQSNGDGVVHNSESLGWGIHSLPVGNEKSRKPRRMPETKECCPLDVLVLSSVHMSFDGGVCSMCTHVASRVRPCVMK